jgi:hypothetical protein
MVTWQHPPFPRGPVMRTLLMALGFCGLLLTPIPMSHTEVGAPLLTARDQGAGDEPADEAAGGGHHQRPRPSAWAYGSTARVEVVVVGNAS